MTHPAKPTRIDRRDLPVWCGLQTFAAHDGLVQTTAAELASSLVLTPAFVEAALVRIEALGLIERVEGGLRLESYREYLGPRSAAAAADEDTSDGST